MQLVIVYKPNGLSDWQQQLSYLVQVLLFCCLNCLRFGSSLAVLVVREKWAGSEFSFNKFERRGEEKKRKKKDSFCKSVNWLLRRVSMTMGDGSLNYFWFEVRRPILSPTILIQLLFPSYFLEVNYLAHQTSLKRSDWLFWEGFLIVICIMGLCRYVCLKISLNCVSKLTNVIATNSHQQWKYWIPTTI